MGVCALQSFQGFFYVYTYWVYIIAVVIHAITPGSDSSDDEEVEEEEEDALTKHYRCCLELVLTHNVKSIVGCAI